MKGAKNLINNVVLVGRLTRDAELRYTSGGTAVASFTVALDRPFSNKNGEKDTDFINCVAWRKTAETLANFTRKGSLVGVQGRIQSRNYTNQSGQKVYVTEVVCENFSMLEPKSVTERRAQQDGDSSISNNFNQSQQNNSFNQAQAPNKNNNQSNQSSSFNQDPFANTGDPIDISDDDLPF